MDKPPQPIWGELYDSFMCRWWDWWNARLERLCRQVKGQPHTGQVCFLCDGRGEYLDDARAATYEECPRCDGVGWTDVEHNTKKGD